MRPFQSLAACLVAVLAAVVLAPAVSADELSFDDPVDDVVGQTSGDAQSEPGVDITSVDVDHQARELEVRVTVARITPLDDPVWSTGQLSVTLFISETGGSDVDSVDFVWSFLADGAGGATGDLSSVSSDDFFGCATAAAVDERADQYIFTAGPECLNAVPRSVAVRAATSFDPQPDNPDFFDFSQDFAPDNRYSNLVATGGSATVTRIAGPDRVETAIALSADRFGDGGATAAVLASSADFPDAIAAGPLATEMGGPVLLTGSDGLDPRVETELVRALPPGSDVFILGGTGALNASVTTDVSQAGFHPRRISGANRFETAVAVADELTFHQLVVIADGRGFRESLIAASAAAALGGVVVLTDGATLPPATDDFLAHDSTRHLAIGIAALAAPGAERITASSAAELSVKVLDRLLPDVRIVGVASMGTFADALAGAPHLAAMNGGLLLTGGEELSPEVAAELAARRDDVREVVLFGGTGAISSGVDDEIRSVLATPSD